MRSPPASSGGVHSTRRPRPHSACPVLCGWHLTRGDGRVCVGISSWAQEVRLHTVQPPQLGATPPHPPGRPRRGGRSVCAGQVRRLRSPSTSRPLATGGARDAIATGSPPRLRHPLRPPCVIHHRRGNVCLYLPNLARSCDLGCRIERPATPLLLARRASRVGTE